MPDSPKPFWAATRPPPRVVLPEPPPAPSAVAAPPPPEPEPQLDLGHVGEEEVRRLLVRLLAAVVLVVFAGGIAAVARHDKGDTPSEAEDPGAAVVAQGAGALGPGKGTALATYTASQRSKLALADGRHAAVVSFQTYQTEASAKEIVGGGQVALLAAAPGGGGSVVRGSMQDWADKAAADAKAERDELLNLQATTDDENFRKQNQADADRLTALIAAIDPSRPVVYAAVVVADADRLRALAADPRTRLVDIGASASVPGDDAIAGLRPEETVEAGQPATRPVG